MLSRVADALYWMGRYLERAENVSRMLLVTCQTSIELEGFDEAMAQAEWDELLAAVGAKPSPDLDYSISEGLAFPFVKRLLLDPGETASVLHSITRARDNARSIREALTREVFSDLNETHRRLGKIARRGLRGGSVGAVEEAQAVHRDVLTTLGSIEHTLTRDEGWRFMKLGEAMERTTRTLLVLATKLPTLGEEPTGDLPLLYARWRGLLRAVASLENYRASQGPALVPREVSRFLLFERSAPRAVLCGVERIIGYLDHFPGGVEVSEADRVLGRMYAELRFEDDRILAGDVAGWCRSQVDRLAEAHDAVVRQYFPV